MRQHHDARAEQDARVETVAEPPASGKHSAMATPAGSRISLSACRRIVLHQLDVERHEIGRAVDGEARCEHHQRRQAEARRANRRRLSTGKWMAASPRRGTPIARRAAPNERWAVPLSSQPSRWPWARPCSVRASAPMTRSKPCQSSLGRGGRSVGAGRKASPRGIGEGCERRGGHEDDAPVECIDQHAADDGAEGWREDHAQGVDADGDRRERSGKSWKISSIAMGWMRPAPAPCITRPATSVEGRARRSRGRFP